MEAIGEVAMGEAMSVVEVMLTEGGGVAVDSGFESTIDSRGDLKKARKVGDVATLAEVGER